MKNFTKHFIFFTGAFFALIVLPFKALAFCPVCVVGTGAGIGFFRWLGVDDSIIGLWTGGFFLSSAILINNFLIKKNKKFKFQLFFVLLALYLPLVLFLYGKSGFLNPYNEIFGISKIIFGIILGSILLALSPFLNELLKKQNQGKVFISHQKVLISITSLLIFSFIFYLFIK